MRRYSVLSALPLSFFSKSLYRDVGQQWRGIGFFYLLLLAALSWAPYTYFTNKGVQDFLVNRAPQLVAQVPTIHVINGKLTTDEKKPYFIKDPVSGRLLVIVDTTGHYTSLAKTDAVMLVTSNELFYLEDHQTIAKKPLANLVDGKDYVNPAKMAAVVSIPFLQKYFAIICFAVGTIAYLFYYLIQTLICSIVAMLFASKAPRHFPYPSIFRLCAVAATPVAITSTLLFIFDISFPYLGLAKVVVTLLYVYFAIKANTTQML